MHASIVAGERPDSKRGDGQRASTTGNDTQTQRDIGGVCEVAEPVFVEDRIVQMCRNELDAINLCIDLSRMSDEALCQRLGVDKGHWSRIRKGRAHFPTAKRIALMRLAGNWAPIQYELGISGVGRRLRDAWAASQAERQQGAGQWQSFGAAA